MSKPHVVQMPAAVNSPLFMDRLENLVAGLGTSKDKGYVSRFVSTNISDQELIDAYTGTWLAQKIVDIIPDDMTREWRSWQASKEQITALEETERRLDVRGKLADVIRWARLYGGAGLVVGAGAGTDLAQPLEPAKVGKDGLRYLHVVDKTKLRAGDLEDKIDEPNFGNPRFYDLSSGAGASVKLHHTRVIRFIGHKRPPTVTSADGWGDSSLVALYEALKNSTVVSAVIASLLYEAKVDIIKVPELSAHLQTEAGTKQLTERFGLANVLKSINNMLLIGDGEEHTSKQINFSGFPELHIRFMQEVSGAADIPVVRMLGQSPAGLNSTGESDLRMYYDMIKSRQENELRHALMQLDEMIINSALGSRPPELFYLFNPLWQSTPEQKAETANKKATVFTHDVNSGLFSDEALAEMRTNQLIEDGTYPGLEQIIAKQGGIVKTPEEKEQEARLQAGAFDEPSITEDAAPRTLYVHRNVLNWKELERWALAQGFKSTQGSGMHVTLAYSKEPVDWMKIGTDYSDKFEIPKGGPRLVEPLGDEGAIVLLFSSWALAYRHGEMRSAGAAWQYEDYQPHITITYDKGDVDLSKIEPYRGKIVLGPEIFEEIDGSGTGKAKEREGITDDARALLQATALDALGKMGIKSDRVKFMDGAPRSFKLGEGTFNSIVATDRKAGTITFYMDAAGNKGAAHVAALAVHEGMHVKYSMVQQALDSEYSAAGRDALNKDGTLKAGLEDQYPLIAALAQYGTPQALKTMMTIGGVTPYSEAFWDALRDRPNLSFDSAVHETLAETARLLHDGAAIPQGKELWRAYHDAISAAYRHIMKTIGRE